MLGYTFDAFFILSFTNLIIFSYVTRSGVHLDVQMENLEISIRRRLVQLVEIRRYA